MISLSTAMIVGGVSVVVEGFFSGSEIAMVSANRARLREKAQKGDRGALMVEQFLAQPQTLLATTLIGTNLSLLVFSVTVAIALIGNAGSEAPSELLAIALVTPLTMIFGEVIPKTLFQHFADRLVTKIVYPLRLASIVLRPLVWGTSGFATLMTRLLHTDRERAFITRDELLLLIDSEAESMGKSEITEDEREMIANVIEMGDAEVEHVMVHLSEVTALPEDTTIGEAALEVADKQHSRMPVYRTRVDDIVGVLHVFDLLQAGATNKNETISAIMRPPTFVPGNKPAVDLLVELQGTGNAMAVVVDEYGGAVGIVTIEDLLEEIVGEIEDEFDEPRSPIHQERPGVWKVEARTSVERINEELGLELPEDEEYESIGGLMLDRFKRIPNSGESLVIAGVTLRVVRASDRAIERVQILRRRTRRSDRREHS